MNTLTLQTELSKAEYANLTAQEAANKINAERTILDFTTFNLPRRVVKSWLLEIGKLTAVLAGTDPVSRQLAFILSDPDYGDIAVFDALAQNLFNQAVNDGLFTSAQKLALENKAKIFTFITAQDVNVARWAEQIAAFEPLAAQARTRLAAIEAILDDLKSGNAFHELSEVG